MVNPRYSDNRSVKTRKSMKKGGKTSPVKKYKSGGKVCCRGMGAATQGGSYKVK